MEMGIRKLRMMGEAELAWSSSTSKQGLIG